MQIRFERQPDSEDLYRYIVKNRKGQKIYYIEPRFDYVERRGRTIYKRFWYVALINPKTLVCAHYFGYLPTYSQARKTIIDYEKKHKMLEKDW